MLSRGQPSCTCRWLGKLHCQVGHSLHLRRCQCSGTVTWAGTAGSDTSCVEIVMSHDWELTGDGYPHLGDVGGSEAALMVLPDNGTALHMRFPALNSSDVKVRIPKCS